jgi:hypothetical protein
MATKSDPTITTDAEKQPLAPIQKPVAGFSPLFMLLLCISSTFIGALGYRYYAMSTAGNQETIPVNTEKSMENKVVNNGPSPTPVPLHAGKGDYSVSHPKSNGPTIQRVIFDPLDAKKGEVLKISAVIMNPTEDGRVTGSLATDTSQMELNFSKSGMEKNSQIWSTEITLTDSVSYNYIVSLAAINAQGKTTVRVAPRAY